MSKCLESALLGAGLLALLGAGVAAAPKTAMPGTHAQAASAQAVRHLGIGREAKPDEIAGWDIDIRPDGTGLPAGRGTVKQGEAVYMRQCTACHGEFGEGAGRWPIVSGGAGTLASHDPVKSIGSYWPYASTVMDYIRRAMPFGNAQSLTNDELYAVTAYVFYLNDIVRDEHFELNANSFKTIKLPNEPNFRDDDRQAAEKALWRKSPCMTNCLPGRARIVGRARVIDVTPEPEKSPKVD
jgi:S-disulfanyl-L-cysteine oxidoreductase SoxD